MTTEPHICTPPFSGWLKEGEEWSCPACGFGYTYFEDEAEGGFWDVKKVKAGRESHRE